MGKISIRNKVRDANNIISKLERIAVGKDVDVNTVQGNYSCSVLRIV